MLILYRLLAILTAPFLLWRLQRPASGDASLLERRRERLGRVASAGDGPLWVHAASVGEVNAVRALVLELVARYPERRVVVSTFTISGARQAMRLFADRVEHRLAPMDTPAATRRWLACIQPVVGLIAETELWPELFHQSRKAGIALVLVNARLSERGLTRSRRLRGLFANTLAAVHLALCQSNEDARRLVELGLAEDTVRVTGNLKFDLGLPDDLGQKARQLRAQWGERRAWVAGSTRPGEEAILLEAHQQLLKRYADALLILVPRHPERANEIDALTVKAGLRLQRFDQSVEAATSVVLVDRIGQLQACYAAAAAAFVGGSLVDIGGHNLLEPAACGKGVMAGPYLYNQQEMADALDKAGALIKVTNAEQIATEVDRVWSEPEQALSLGRAALEVVERGRGSLKKTLRQMEPLLPGPSENP